MFPITRSGPVLRAFLALLLGASASGAWADDAADVRALITRGDLAGALARAEKAVATRPRDAQLRFLQGVVLMDLKRDEAAVAVFQQLAQEFPELPDPHNNLALLQVRAGQLESAQQSLETALRNDPSHRIARANLGQVHLMLAVKSWELAAAAAPVDPALQRRLEGARSLLGSPATAAR